MKAAQEYAKKYRCPICERLKRPHVSQKVSVRKSDEFREILCMDLSWVEDVDGKKWNFLSVTDALRRSRRRGCCRARTPRWW